MQEVTLREIVKCTFEQKTAVRDIRNQESVRRSMYTDHMIGLEEHLAWIERLEKDTRQIVFVVFLDGIVSGLVSVNALDRLHKKSDWAFYLDSKARGGLGAVLEFSLINYAFDEIGLEKLNCEVIETNPAVVKMHLKFGFVEEGFRRSNIEKDGKRIGVHFLGLTKDDWVIKRDEISENYKSIFEKFQVHIDSTLVSV
ncbi:UDP-4-amino-4,6-dideoxy-N-acetyl-beta-L-altrosamine N-acetyltransferase [Chromobacterium vaccinii]|uniref:UDP-4-amino-4, 6-dideoxy-N-acetyl-beta-L-altrosamine N-acetyltransferase n=1 Tax=Chromobacterium vaccinii TaxID=1108595 RepID=UPI000E11AD18|nr:UDP-4-amino-4,6-dideoxy-N-acetyl-beta-L-altrosamine N-acetyltransferase [Chromobacterium vaccinii]SUX30172.1 pseudaminic acid biosynthesis N-acetyl transferase [Chromobacterium vaccinii]